MPLEEQVKPERAQYVLRYYGHLMTVQDDSHKDI